MAVNRVTVTCKHCSRTRTVPQKAFLEQKSLRASYCCMGCYRHSPEWIESRRRGDAIRVQKIDFHRSGKLAFISQARRWLTTNGIEHASLTDDEACHLYSSSRCTAKLVAAQQEGRIKKHGDLRESYRRGAETDIKRRVGATDDEWNSLSEEDRALLKNYAHRNFKVTDKIDWMRKHAKNLGVLNHDTMPADELTTWFSSYMSHRAKLLTGVQNGWKRTKKSWYQFCDGTRIWCISSWETVCCEKLNELLQKGSIKRVFVPERIPYQVDGVTRHYYPDIGYETTRERVYVCEIKPARAVATKVNTLKFQALFRHALDHEYTAVILTEKEIFEKNERLFEHDHE